MGFGEEPYVNSRLNKVIRWIEQRPRKTAKVRLFRAGNAQDCLGEWEAHELVPELAPIILQKCQDRLEAENLHEVEFKLYFEDRTTRIIGTESINCRRETTESLIESAGIHQIDKLSGSGQSVTQQAQWILHVMAQMFVQNSSTNLKQAIEMNRLLLDQLAQSERSRMEMQARLLDFQQHAVASAREQLMREVEQARAAMPEPQSPEEKAMYAQAFQMVAGIIQQKMGLVRPMAPPPPSPPPTGVAA